MGRTWRATSASEGGARVTIPSSCTPYWLPTGLIIPLGPTTTTLTDNIIVTPGCFTEQSQPTGTSGSPDADAETISLNDLRDPFYASTVPMAYSIAATTTLAYVLLLLLFLPNPPNRRPWLQKVATLTVCICLTIAFAETTDVLNQEYKLVGSSVYTLANEAREVRERVVAGMPMKIGRIISDLFLWLAQVQTLIRLFPREREKVVIKWAGFCLIVLDTLSSVLQAFVSPMHASTESFLDAIPALSYLFQISLSLLYACCVVYYSFAKRRYAWFYQPTRPFRQSAPAARHYGARSIILVAMLSIIAVTIPLVFFIIDIAQKDLAGWGDYIRWVGAASASVVVWEWVDRIEGLEREERKDGVLGREVYEEDEDDRYTSHRDAMDDEPPPAPSPARLPPAGSATSATSSTSYAVHMRQVNTNTDPRPPPTITTASSDTPPPSSPRPACPAVPDSPPPPQRSDIWRPWKRRKRSDKERAPPPEPEQERLPVTIVPPPPRGGRTVRRALSSVDGAGSAVDVPLPLSRSVSGRMSGVS